MNHDMAMMKLANGVYLYQHPAQTYKMVECLCDGCTLNRGSRLPTYWYSVGKRS